ncbi:MAG: hypothetical protein ACEPOV_10690 [Hyphomicrobiales bacterium]
MKNLKDKHKNEVFNHIALILLQFSFLSLAHIFLFKIDDVEIINDGIQYISILSVLLIILGIYTYIRMLFNKKEVMTYEEAARIIYNKTKTILLISTLNFAVLSISYALFESTTTIVLLIITVLIQILSTPSMRMIKYYFNKQEGIIKDYPYGNDEKQ